MALKPNTDLLNYQFETYRVSFKNLESITTELHSELYNWNNRKCIDNFSKIKAFSISSDIFLDDFFTNNVYIISNELTIFNVSLCENIFHVTQPTIVYKCEAAIKSPNRQSPPVLFFPSSKISCLYDGTESLFVFFTNNRCTISNEDNSESWKLLYSTIISRENCDVTLLECRIETFDITKDDIDMPLSGKILHCCYLKIHNVSFDKNIELTWIKYKYCHQSNQLTILSEKVWRGVTPPELVTFSSDFGTLEILGDHSFRYIPADVTIETLSCDNIKTLASWWQDSNNYILVQYYLKMNSDNFSIDIVYPDENSDELVILFIIKEKEPMELHRQNFHCTFDKNDSKWFIKNGILNIKLKKFETEEVETVFAKQSKVTFNQYEEVDNCDDTNLALVSFDGSSGAILEEIGISTKEWLFKIRLSPGAPLSPCIRSNVDGLLWYKDASSTAWSHRYTLDAFGYVSASKVDRKYITCSLPLIGDDRVRFAVISDWKRTVCVYMQCNEIDTDMAVKNRVTGHTVSNTADEFLLSMDKCQEIMGVVANASALFVLYKTTEGATRVTVVKCV